MVKKNIFIISLVIIAVLSAFASLTLDADKMAFLGAEHKKIREKGLSGKIIAKVNGKEIYSDTIENLKHTYEVLGLSISEDKIIEKVITDELLLSEAKKTKN